MSVCRRTQVGLGKRKNSIQARLAACMALVSGAPPSALRRRKMIPSISLISLKNGVHQFAVLFSCQRKERPAGNFPEISPRINPQFSRIFGSLIFFGKPPNCEEICGGYVRRFENRVAGSNPKFGKIRENLAGLCHENSERRSVESLQFLAKFRGLPGRNLHRGKRTGTGTATRRKHNDLAGVPLQRLPGA